ncbi:hypothetical protein HHK36_000056 [Tetracentron sinense]|uniref:Uncharacterized protein n=1 Tax=Tetracentron sinense TaxID=13715 RepID=A0A835A0C3_TETSI|nr:hypothetical protein HHK36_000056 [Tetracentron sinense]
MDPYVHEDHEFLERIESGTPPPKDNHGVWVLRRDSRFCFPFVDVMSSSSSLYVPQAASNYDELSMQQSLLFSDSLKDLKNLRAQLYSAAEYFELSYSNDDKKYVVVDTLKDYVIKALINTVDHLGSVTYKVNNLLDEKVDEGSRTELRVSCIEQVLFRFTSSTFSGIFLDLRIKIIKETMHGTTQTKSKYQGCSLDDEDDWHNSKSAIQAKIRETPSSSFRKGCSPSPSPRPGNFSFSGIMSNKEPDKRTVSPYRFPLLRSGSLSSRPTATKSSNARRYPSEPRKSASMPLPAERHGPKEIEQHPNKSRRILKALLSRRKSKKDDMLYTGMSTEREKKIGKHTGA